MLFTLKIYLFGPKIAFKAFCTRKDTKKFCKNQFFSNIFTFLSVTLQNLEDNLRILANFGKFSRKKLRNLRISPVRFKKTVFFFVYFNEDYISYNKNLFIRPKIGFKAFFATKDAKKFRKNQFFSNIFTFLKYNTLKFLRTT